MWFDQVARRLVPVLLAGFALFTTACLSSGIRSTGALLPQTTTDLGDGELRANVRHRCSGGRCEALTVEFENQADAPVEVVASDSSLTRAGETLALSIKGAQGNEVVVIPPKGRAEADFVAVNPKTKAPMSYVQASAVWCSLKVHDQCQNPSKGEAMCAGFARYYYQTYVTTGGWISLKFTYRKGDRTADISTVPPNFMGNPPPVRLESTSDAPSWLSGSDEVVFHKIECDEKCRCKDLDKRRNFFSDDKFLPIKE